MENEQVTGPFFENRPSPWLYLVTEAFLILVLAYFVFVSGSFLGLYVNGPRIISQAIFGLVAAVWLLSKVSPRWPWPRNRSWPHSPIDYPLMATLAVIIVASLQALSVPLSIEVAGQLFAYALAFWMLYEVMAREWVRQLYLKSLLIVAAMACLMAFIGLAYWYFGLPNGPSWPSLGLGLLPPPLPRLTATLGNPNILAAFLVPLVPFTVGYGFSRAGAARWMSLALGLLIGVTLLLTQSRAGLLGMVAGSATLFVASLSIWVHRVPGITFLRRQPIVRFVLLGSAMTFLLVALIVVTGRGTLFSLVRGATGRVDLWTDALRMAGAYPLLGVGPGCFGQGLLLFRDAGQQATLHSHAHNLYLHALATLGIVGALAVIWLTGKLLWSAWGLLRKESVKAHRWIRAAAIGAIVGFLGQGMLEALAYEVAGVFLLVISMAAVVLQPTDNTDKRSHRPVFLWIFPAAISVLFVAIVVFTVRSDRENARFQAAASLAQQGEWRAAITILEDLCEDNPGFDYYCQMLGFAYGYVAVTEDDSDCLMKAIQTYESSGISSDRYAPHHANFAWLLWHVDDHERAKAEMQQAIALSRGRSLTATRTQTADYHINLGVMLEEDGQYDLAQMAYAQAVALFPEWITARFWDERDSDARDRSHLVALAPIYHDPSQVMLTEFHRALLAMSLGGTDDLEEALANALLNERRAQHNVLGYWFGLVGWVEDNPRDALSAADSILESVPHNSTAYLMKGFAYVALDEMEDASAMVRILRFGERNFLVDILDSRLAQRSGDVEAALRSHKIAIENATSVRVGDYGPTVWKRPPLSAEVLPDVVQLPQMEAAVRAHMALAGFYAAQGMSQEAEVEYQQVLRYYPNNPEATQALSELH
jgi:tetratricopeptide (TPR) repeat protein/O-antigen ligase